MSAMNPAAWAGFLGCKWARNWQLTDRTFAGLTERMIDIAEAEPFARVADIGCGAGEMCLRLAQRNPGAQVFGVDISGELVAAAQARLARQANTRVLRADATQWRPQDGGKFDLLLARHVVMFFENPAADLSHLASLAADNGRLLFSCFRTNEENGWIADILGQLPAPARRRIGKDEPGPLAFADTDWAGRVLAENGWRDHQFEAFDYPMVMGEGEDPIGQALDYLMQIGPASFAANILEGKALDEFRQRMRAMLGAYCHDGKVALPAAIWIGSARKS